MGNMLDKLLAPFEKAGETAHVRAAFGEPEMVGNKVLIPVAKVRHWFGLGYGEGTSPAEEEDAPPDEGKGGGGGSWASAKPLGVLEITAGGTTFVPTPNATLLGFMSLLTGLVTGTLFLLFVARPLVRRFTAARESDASCECCE